MAGDQIPSLSHHPAKESWACERSQNGTRGATSKDLLMNRCFSVRKEFPTNYPGDTFLLSLEGSYCNQAYIYNHIQACISREKENLTCNWCLTTPGVESLFKCDQYSQGKMTRGCTENNQAEYGFPLMSQHGTIIHLRSTQVRGEHALWKPGLSGNWPHVETLNAMTHFSSWASQWSLEVETGSQKEI